jgi:hypothetical protein
MNKQSFINVFKIRYSQNVSTRSKFEDSFFFNPLEQPLKNVSIGNSEAKTNLTTKYMLVFIRAVLQKLETSTGAIATGECF